MNVFDEIESNEFIKQMLEKLPTDDLTHGAYYSEITDMLYMIEQQELKRYRLKDVSPSIRELLLELNSEQLQKFMELSNSYMGFENITKEIAEQVALEDVTGCEGLFPSNQIKIVWDKEGHATVRVKNDTNRDE
jgi:hypothetical protein